MSAQLESRLRTPSREDRRGESSEWPAEAALHQLLLTRPSCVVRYAAKLGISIVPSPISLTPRFRSVDFFRCEFSSVRPVHQGECQIQRRAANVQEVGHILPESAASQRSYT